MGTLIDTCILIDLLDEDAEWVEWSTDSIILAMARGPLYVNQFILAELAGGFDRVEEFEAALGDPDIERLNLPWEAAFLVGRAFRMYRGRGGAKTSPMPDFYIGAHAAIAGLDILTRDPDRFTSYFPTVRVISPGAAA